MSRENFLKAIKATRRDISEYLFHFTRGTDQKSAFEVLKEIIEERKLVGSSNNIKGGYKCICFSEAPIAEIISYFNLEHLLNEDAHQNRYAPYGIAFKKDVLFEKGCRPVVYQPLNEFDALDDSIKFKHVTYSPTGTDFSWEREWRIKADELSISASEALIIVPTFEELYELVSEYQEHEPEVDYEFDGERM